MRSISALVLVFMSLGLAAACGDDGEGPPSADAGGGRDAGGVDLDAGPSCVDRDGRCEMAGAIACCGALVCRASSSGAAYCVPAGDTCFVGADPGCCLDDADCGDGQRCLRAECRPGGEGVCKPPPDEGSGACWGNLDCASPAVCEGVVLCPCGAPCAEEDAPGACVAPP